MRAPLDRTSAIARADEKHVGKAHLHGAANFRVPPSVRHLIPGGFHMPAERFVEQLNIQIGNEFAAHQQYVACAVYYDALTMPQTAGFFYNQALEERGHAMM